MAFNVTVLTLSHISIHVIIIFLSNFPIIVFWHLLFFNNCTFSNLKRSVWCYYAHIKPHQHPRYYPFSFQFSYNCFLTFTFFFNNYTFSNLFHAFTFSPTTLSLNITFHLSLFCLFIFPPLPFYLSTILNLNVTIHLPIHLPLFCLFIFTPSSINLLFSLPFFA